MLGAPASVAANPASMLATPASVAGAEEALSSSGTCPGEHALSAAKTIADHRISRSYALQAPARTETAMNLSDARLAGRLQPVSKILAGSRGLGRERAGNDGSSKRLSRLLNLKFA